MKILKILTAFTLMFYSALVLADPPAQVGRLNYLAGGVSFAPAEANDDWSAAILNRPVTTGDRLWTGADGRAEMHIGSTAIRIPALTSLDVLSLDDERGTQLRLAQGAVNVRLRRLDVDQNFEISTPSGAVLLTQPGSYRVIVDPSGSTTTVVAHRGEADVLTGGTPFTLREGQLATLSDNGRRIYPAPQLDEFDNWSAARDRREDNLAATRYVPREMTGYEDLDQHGTWDNVEQYGAVWYPTAVSADWAPFRHGHWLWVSPWGWTWVDDAPWGFAPSHYGRWVRMGHRWAWAPGARAARPVYAPAIVAFIGGGNWSVSIGSGPAVGWVPLGWREPYIPWYRSSPAHVRNVNVAYVTDMNVIHHYSNVRSVNNVRYVNRGVPSATTVVLRDAFVAGQRADRSLVRVPAQVLANARITHEAPVTRPDRTGLTTRPAPRVPEGVAARDGFAVKAPPAPAAMERDGKSDNDRSLFGQREDRSRVRVMDTQPPRAGAPVRPSEAESRVVPDQSRSQAQGAPAQPEQRPWQLQQQRMQQEQQPPAQQERMRREQQNAQERQQRDQQQAVLRAQQEERQLQQQRVQREHQQRTQQERAQQEQQNARERQLREQQQASQRAQQEERPQQQQRVQQERVLRDQQNAREQHQRAQQRQAIQRTQQEERQRQLQQQQPPREQRQADRAAEVSRPQPLPQARPPQLQPEKPVPAQRQQREPSRNSGDRD